MDDKTRRLIIWIVCAVSLVFAFVLYQGMVVEPQRERDAAAKVRTDAKNADDWQRLSLGYCLEAADADYWSWVRLNMELQDDGTYTGSNYNWDKAEKSKKVDEDACYRQYSNN